MLTVQDGKIRLKSLEYFLTDRCNLRCQHCSASSPFLREGNLAEVDDFRRDLQNLEPILRSEQVKFLGGEPLLHKSICDFLRVAKESGVFGLIRVTTNGVLLPRMGESFWELADIVEISRYDGVEVPDEEGLAELSALAESHGGRLEVNPIDRFMKSTVDTKIEDPRLVQRIFSTCGEAHAWSCHLLHRGRIYRCSRVHTLDRHLDQIGVDHLPFTELDGVLIDDRDGLLEDVSAYLGSKTPLNACSFCLGTSGTWIKNRQLKPAEVKERRSGVTRPFDPADLVHPKEAYIRNLITTWSTAGKIEDPPTGQ